MTILPKAIQDLTQTLSKFQWHFHRTKNNAKIQMEAQKTLYSRRILSWTVNSGGVHCIWPYAILQSHSDKNRHVNKWTRIEDKIE